MQRRLAVGLVALGFALALGTVASAAIEFPIEIMQPIVTEEGIFLSSITYVSYAKAFDPGAAVPFVCRESRVFNDSGISLNRNAANLIGARSDIDAHHRTGQLYGDTLKVFLELTAPATAPDLFGWSMDAAVDATIECVLLAVFKSRGGRIPGANKRALANYVSLEVRGSPRYAAKGGVFAFDALGQLPRKRRFN